MAQKVTVRYGAMGMVGIFSTEMPGLRRGQKVVLKTERGTEAGEIVHTAEEMGESQGPVEGEAVRLLSAQDEASIRRVQETQVPKELAFCRDRIKSLELPMKLVDAEHLLGGEKIIFYFLADGRVDFRQLVKDIAREYKTRIELRQIGVRDEARLLAELGHCGQCLCCRSFMKSLEPVTMRMAKSQKATLDPTKISGVCGRLMCCLRYEDKVYTDLKAKLPKRGSMIVTKKATGKLVDADILAQVLTLKTASSNIIRVHVSEVLSIDASGNPPAEARPATADAAQAAPQESACPGHGAGEAPCPNCPQQGQGASRPQGEAPRQEGRRDQQGGRDRQRGGRDQRRERPQGPQQGQGGQAQQGGQGQGQSQQGGQGQGRPGQGQSHGPRRHNRRNRPPRSGGSGQGGNGGNPSGGNPGGGSPSGGPSGGDSGGGEGK
jgi:cell fate regulator YaaT (PSP1 superfamily)